MQNPGVIFYTDSLPAEELASFAQRLEELGYDCLFVPEFFGREPYSTVSFVLARTTTLRVATGIANLYSHDALVAAQSRHTLAELSGGRFILGLGVSHPPMAEMHGLEWVPPYQKMKAYIETVLGTEVQAPPPAAPAPIWLATNGPLILKLASEQAQGVSTYLMPPAHTQKAREIIGPDTELNVVLPCCMSEDPDRARLIARKALSIYMPLPAYRNQWKEWGFDDADYENGGSDRLIDSCVAWGNEATIRARINQHEEAGADRIIVSALNHEGRGPAWKLLEALAPV